jgi:lysophospholipase L1-like esterase
MRIVVLHLLLVLVLLAADSADAQTSWVGTWASSQQIPEPANALPAADLADATLRQVVHLSVGGAALRVHLSNAFGTEPLHITSVHVARPVSRSAARIDPASDRAVDFSGAGDVTIPAGAEYISDPVDSPVAALSDLAITIHIDEAPAQQTGHPGSRATSYVAHGDLVVAAGLPDAKKVDHWYFLAGVDVAAARTAASVVTLGDSITDGHAATTNGNDRWTDVLAERLQSVSATRSLGVLNEGIGGNHLLTDGLGPNVLARFDRDVLAQTGVRSVIVLEGVNDLGGLTRLGEVSASEHHALVARILAAYEQIVLRAHAHGIRVIGATILPYAGSDYYHPLPSSDADRVAVNQWIRAPGHFDAVIDFDKTMRDPDHPDRLLPAYDCGDHLHPSPRGYRVMGESIPLSLFQ